MKDVSIVIPNWNGRELLDRFFASIVAAAEQYQKESSSHIEIILIDDASTDDSREWITSNYGGHEFVRMVELKENLGFLRAVNKGFDSAKYRIVLLLNSDVSVQPDCIAPLVRHFESESVFAVCCHANRIGTDRLDGGGKIGQFKRGFWRVYLNYDVIPTDHNGELISFFGSGGYTAYDHEKWRQLGGFQECLSPNYWEDVEISYRAWKRGWKVLYEPSSIVNHLGSVSMKKRTSKRDLAVVNERNRLLMTWINLHHRGMLTSHVVHAGAKLIGSALTLNWSFLRSFFEAFKMLAVVRKQRSIEKSSAKMSDRKLAEIFEQLIRRPDVHVLRTYEDELRFMEKKNLVSSDANNR